MAAMMNAFQGFFQCKPTCRFMRRLGKFRQWLGGDEDPALTKFFLLRQISIQIKVGHHLLTSAGGPMMAPLLNAGLVVL